MSVYTVIATSVSEGSDEAELDLVVDEFSAEAEAVGYARRMADEAFGMAEQLALDFEYSNVCLYEGDVSEAQPDPSHEAFVGMWWFSDEGAEWADKASMSATEEEPETTTGSPPVGTH